MAQSKSFLLAAMVVGAYACYPHHTLVGIDFRDSVNAIGRITPSGVITEFSSSVGSYEALSAYLRVPVLRESSMPRPKRADEQW